MVQRPTLRGLRLGAGPNVPQTWPRHQCLDWAQGPQAYTARAGRCVGPTYCPMKGWLPELDWAGLALPEWDWAGPMRCKRREGSLLELDWAGPKVLRCWGLHRQARGRCRSQEDFTNFPPTHH
jgi:hypothetical protein